MVARPTLVGQHHFYEIAHLLSLLLPHAGPGEAKGKRKGVLVHIVLSSSQQGLLERGRGEGRLSKTRVQENRSRLLGQKMASIQVFLSLYRAES